MPDASTLQFLFQLARGIAGQFGPNCEVVVHDLASNDPESSIVAIENGHVTGRKVGDGPSHVVLEVLRGDPATLKDPLFYLTRTRFFNDTATTEIDKKPGRLRGRALFTPCLPSLWGGSG